MTWITQRAIATATLNLWIANGGDHMDNHALEFIKFIGVNLDRMSKCVKRFYRINKKLTGTLVNLTHNSFEINNLPLSWRIILV